MVQIRDLRFQKGQGDWFKKVSQDSSRDILKVIVS